MYFHFFTVVGRQHDCRLKSKNPSVLSAFSVQSSLKREDFCPTRYKIAAILPYGKIFNAVQAKICRFKPYRVNFLSVLRKNAEICESKVTIVHLKSIEKIKIVVYNRLILGKLHQFWVIFYLFIQIFQELTFMKML